MIRKSIYNTETFSSAPRTAWSRAVLVTDTDYVHAAVQESAANAFPGPIVDVDVPRIVTATFAAGWQGGDITITGINALGAAATETIADNPGATVSGTTLWRSVTGISKETVAGTTDTVSVGIAAVNYYSSAFYGYDGYGLTVMTTGTLAGTWTLWMTDDLDPYLGDDTAWVQDTSFSPTNPAGAATKFRDDTTGAKARHKRLKFVPSSGAGNLIAYVTVPNK
jgi:hypothetical protein